VEVVRWRDEGERWKSGYEENGLEEDGIVLRRKEERRWDTN
jgi:hypothetical protein